MTWQLIGGVGIDRESCAPSLQHNQESLCFPTYAGRAADGTYVIAEERGIEKHVPFRFECRTFRVDPLGQLLFDTQQLGWTDAYGCLLENGDYAILRRTTWELFLLSQAGHIVDRISLHQFSKRLPRYVTVLDEDTLLVVFYNRSFEVDIVEITRNGKLRWFLPRDARYAIGIPGSVLRTPKNTLLIADSFRHVVCELDRMGQLVWQFGEMDHPANDSCHCSSPTSVCLLPDDRILVADSRNHRAIVIQRDTHGQSPQSAEAQAIKVRGPSLCDPVFAERLADGNTLICDPGNREVREIDPRGKTVWRFGNPCRDRRLSYPRSVEVLSPPSSRANDGGGLEVTEPVSYVVADTGSDRVVALQDDHICEWVRPGTTKLFWPRCARMLPSGNLLIADARHGRIVEMSPQGDILRQLHKLTGPVYTELRDPHDVRMLPNGHLLVTDSPQNVVLETDWSGTVFRCLDSDQGVPLKDPHSAQQLDDGSWIISDTGHHRILHIDQCHQSTHIIDTVRRRSLCWRLHLPRYAELADTGTLVIADTGQNRILGATLQGDYLWEFSRVPDTSLPFLNQPRWATMLNAHELLVSDHFHHRILHLRWSGDDLPRPKLSGNPCSTAASSPSPS